MPSPSQRSRILFSGGGIPYLIRDEFDDVRAAGAVNGTPPTPGPGGNRTVVDTDGNKTSIGGGELAYAPKGVITTGDPGLWESSVDRVAGRVLLSHYKSSVLGSTDFDFDTNPSAAPVEGLRTSAVLTTVDAGVGISTGQPILNGVDYFLGISLRIVGAYKFIKGGIYLQWTLVWIGNTGSATPLFAAIANRDSTAVSRFLRVADSYIPVPFAYDTFGRGNGALGSSENIGPDGQAVAVLPWTGATWTIVTNKAVNTPVPGADVIINGGFGADTDWNKGANQTIAAGKLTGASATSDTVATVPPLTVGVWYQSTFTQTGFGAGTIRMVLGTSANAGHTANSTFTEVARAVFSGAFTIRAQGGWIGSVDDVLVKPLTLSELFASVNPAASADVHARVSITLSGQFNNLPAGLVLNLDNAVTPLNFILAYLDGKGQCILDECVNGVYTNKIAGAITYSAGALLYVIRRGNSCFVYYNSIQVGTVQTMTPNTNRLFGMFGPSPLNQLDQFEVTPDGLGGYHSELDRLLGSSA